MHRSISVIIPTHNYGRFIATAIRSVLEQSYRISEIIVVDDGSTDDTAAIVKLTGAPIKYIRQSNAGVSAARNRGVAESNGDLIAFLDADDIWEPAKVGDQIAEFDKDPAVELVLCGMREFDGDTDNSIGFYLHGVDTDLARDLLVWERPSVNVSGSVIMVSRMAFEAVGGFDVAIKCGEDWDFCYRVGATLNQLLFLPRS